MKSLKWAQGLRQAEIVLVMSSICHPRGNIVERTNKEIRRFLRTLLASKNSERANWTAFIEQTLNNTYQDTIEYTPIEAHFDKRPE